MLSQFPYDEDRDGPRNVGVHTAQPSDAAARQRTLYRNFNLFLRSIVYFDYPSVPTNLRGGKPLCVGRAGGKWHAFLSHGAQCVIKVGFYSKLALFCSVHI